MLPFGAAKLTEEQVARQTEVRQRQTQANAERVTSGWSWLTRQSARSNGAETAAAERGAASSLESTGSSTRSNARNVRGSREGRSSASTSMEMAYEEFSQFLRATAVQAKQTMRSSIEVINKLVFQKALPSAMALPKPQPRSSATFC